MLTFCRWGETKTVNVTCFMNQELVAAVGGIFCAQIWDYHY